MANLWHSINISKQLVGVVEMPRGTMLKYELEKTTGALILDRVLNTPVPANYGFIPSTLSEDGDPLDVFIYSGYAIEPMTIVKIAVERVILMLDNGQRDEKIVATVVGDKMPWHGADKRLNATLRYLTTYKQGIKVVDVLNHEAAIEVINIAGGNYMKKFYGETK